MTGRLWGTKTTGQFARRKRNGSGTKQPRSSPYVCRADAIFSGLGDICRLNQTLFTNNRMGIVWIGKPGRSAQPVAVSELNGLRSPPVLRVGCLSHPPQQNAPHGIGKPTAHRDPRRLRRQTDIAPPTGGEW